MQPERGQGALKGARCNRKGGKVQLGGEVHLTGGPGETEGGESAWEHNMPIYVCLQKMDLTYLASFNILKQNTLVQ